MSRNEVNRFGEMDVFVRVVDMGGFSAAARTLRMTPSAVSKLMARLETRLGTRLLSRSTRMLQLTPEGTAFYESSLRILADLEEAERFGSLADIAGCGGDQTRDQARAHHGMVFAQRQAHPDRIPGQEGFQREGVGELAVGNQLDRLALVEAKPGQALAQAHVGIVGRVHAAGGSEGAAEA